MEGKRGRGGGALAEGADGRPGGARAPQGSQSASECTRPHPTPPGLLPHAHIWPVRPPLLSSGVHPPVVVPLSQGCDLDLRAVVPIVQLQHLRAGG